MKNKFKMNKKHLKKIRLYRKQQMKRKRKKSWEKEDFNKIYINYKLEMNESLSPRLSNSILCMERY